jgi:hypothetical protein
MVDLDLAPSGAAYVDDAAPMELGRFFAGGSTKRCRAYGAEVGRAVLCAPPTANKSVLVHHDGGQGTARPTT